MRHNVRRLLTAGVLLTILLPMVIAVALGLGALLGALGDDDGAKGCGRIGLAIGGAWLLSVAATATAGGILMLEDGAGRPDSAEPDKTGRGSRDGFPQDT